MTIDEAIKQFEYDAECNRADLDLSYAKDNEQVAEWLKLLKWYEQGMEDIPSESGVLPKDVYHAGYNKAVDDLRNELKNHYTEYNIDCVLADTSFYSYTTACNYLEDYIDEIAEQLKAGISNET